MKVCPRCKTAKTPEEFYKNKSTFDGLAYHCKQCHRAADKDYYKRSKRAKRIKTLTVDDL